MEHANADVIERKAIVFNVQKYNMYDGPGIRTNIFFKGCPLRCQWCANPEGMERRIQVMFKQSYCVNCGSCVNVCPEGIHILTVREGVHRVLRDRNCIGCRKCKASCPHGALDIAGELKTISELLKIVEEDNAFYEISNGGVTLTGGECTFQRAAAQNLLMACKAEGINTAVETCGQSPMEGLLEIAEYVDLFLYDIKHMDPERHNELTGMGNEGILQNLKELLHGRYNVKVRMPMLKGINDSREEIEQVICFLLPFRDFDNFKGIDLLPYHKLGVNKYRQLDMEYAIEGDLSLNKPELDRIEGWIRKHDFPVSIIRH